MAKAVVSAGALEGRKRGQLLKDDVIVAHHDGLLVIAVAWVKAMAARNWRRPLNGVFPVAGQSGIVTIKAQLVGLRGGGFISAHDFHIASLIADVVCGGEVAAGLLVREANLMALARKHVSNVLEDTKSKDRIMGSLRTGKPVRN